MQGDRKKIIQLIQDMHESPDAKEQAILEENKLTLSDEEVKGFIQSFHMETDRKSALQKFLSSAYARNIVSTVEKCARADKNVSICEIGAGDGFLALALVKAGFTSVDILEPSSSYITGTGYLRELQESKKITIHTDLKTWYDSNKRYDIIITHACIHHFQNPLFVISQARLKAHGKTKWLAFGEFFAIDYADMISQLLNHRHATLYKLYEFPYSASLYRKMFESAGFKLREVMPHIHFGQSIFPRLRGSLLFRKADSLIWKIIRCMRLTWPAYRVFSFALASMQRNKIRDLDLFCMVFEAKAIQWKKIRGNAGFFPLKIVGSERLKTWAY